MGRAMTSEGREAGAWVSGVVTEARAAAARKAAAAALPPAEATDDEQAEAFGRVRAAWDSLRGVLVEQLGVGTLVTVQPGVITIGCPHWLANPYLTIRADGAVVTRDGHDRKSTEWIHVVRVGGRVELRWHGEALEPDALVRQVLEPWLKTLIAAER